MKKHTRCITWPRDLFELGDLIQEFSQVVASETK